MTPRNRKKVRAFFTRRGPAPRETLMWAERDSAHVFRRRRLELLLQQHRQQEKLAA